MRDRSSPHTATGAGKLSIGALARATGVPVETLRTWEQRYGFPVADRRPSGHRIYSPTIVPHLRRVADALARGHRAAAVVPASDAELGRLLATTAPDAPLAPAPSIPSSGSLDDVMEAVIAFDTGRVTSMMLADWGRLGPVEFLETRAVPLLERVGRGWADGRLDIRHEHFLSERLADILRSLRMPFDGRATGPLAVCATLPGEVPAVGLQMAALILAAAGVRVVYLGTEIPVLELATAARDLGARMVALSVSAAADGPTVKRFLTRLRLSLPRPVTVVLGGQGAPDLRGGFTKMAGFTELDRWARRQASAGPLVDATQGL
ncbi:MAG: cobalamin-dependent protein [Acidobacteria bacterium]|nr:cobalamin-dependent protein [Acidobacteriota bacterium]